MFLIFYLREYGTKCQSKTSKSLPDMLSHVSWSIAWKTPSTFDIIIIMLEYKNI